MTILQTLICLAFLFQICSYQSSRSDAKRCVTEDKCDCITTQGMLTADCSGKNLKHFPEFANNVEIIRLNNNLLEHFGSGIFANLKSLYLLDLSNNQLTLQSQNELPFQSLINLKILLLHSNKMNYSTFGEDLFASLWNLKELDLSKNMQIWSQPYPAAITKCISLRSVRLDGFSGATFDANYKGLSSLEKLSLSGKDSNCKLHNIESSFFQNLPEVKHIDLSLCHVKNIELGTFQHLESLTFLNLSHNHELTFRNLGNITTDLGYTNITTLDLSAIHCTYGVGTYLYVDDVIGLQNTTLQELYVNSNRITMIETGLIPILPKNLSFLSIIDNKFTIGKYVLQVGMLKNLKTLLAESQHQSHFPGDKTNLFKDCEDWRGPKHIESNPIKYNRNNEKEPDSHQQYVCHSKLKLGLPEKLENISFAKSSLQFPVNCLHFSENSVRYIDLRNNLLYRWVGPIYGLKSLEYLDLSSNDCSFVSDVFFNEFPSLTLLNVSENLLGFVLGEDEDGNTFQFLSSLRYLDMTNNRIRILPKNIFRNLSILEILDLSYNQVYYWNFDIIQMSKIKLINMTNNEISSLSSSIRSQIDALKMITNISIDLNRNNLQCTCDSLEFMEWMVENRNLFSNFNNYHCYLRNHSAVNFTEFDKYVSVMQMKCNSYIGLIFGVTAALITCIFVIVGGLVYRYRWRLRYIYFLAKNRYRGYSNSDLRTDGNEYIYDAFVSYSDKDSQFVIQNVQQRLEENRGLRLCFHQRDFIPGKYVAANITNAIQHSRKTIAILSRNYLNSYWCMFEFNMARMESIYSRDGKNVLFFVLYEDIPPRDLPLNMMDIIESQSYIEYPRDQLGDEVFWDKIAEAIEL